MGARNPTPKGRQESGKKQNLIDCWRIPIAFVDGGSEIAADPDGRSLARPVLIADEWRRSDPRDKDGVLAVEGSHRQAAAVACAER